MGQKDRPRVPQCQLIVTHDPERDTLRFVAHWAGGTHTTFVPCAPPGDAFRAASPRTPAARPRSLLAPGDRALDRVRDAFDLTEALLMGITSRALRLQVMPAFKRK